jgi:hypothetical protein
LEKASMEGYLLPRLAKHVIGFSKDRQNSTEQGLADFWMNNRIVLTLKYALNIKFVVL